MTIYDRCGILGTLSEVFQFMIKFFNDKTSMRPALAMLLCACIAFSATASYIPTTSGQLGPSQGRETTQASSEEHWTESPGESLETTEPASTAEAAEAAANPVPYRLNLAYQYPEGSDQSYAEILLRELIRKDSQWYAEIYDMANTAPEKLVRRMGRSAASVRGAYNPASKTQNRNDSSTWAVEHFKNVHISFYDGNGSTSSAVSNAQDILAMASVYAYYNKIEDIDEIRSYMNQLWSISHSYSASMGSVYYCDGCVSTDQRHTDEFEDSELEGEDTFNTDRTISTEISAAIPFARGGLTERGESPEDASEESGNVGAGSGTRRESTSGGTSGVYGGASVSAPDLVSSSAFGNKPAETTTSALQSLAETAESIFIEETRKATIIRVEDTTAAQTKNQPKETTGTAPESQTEQPGTAAPGEPETPAAIAALETAAEGLQTFDYPVRTAVLPAQPEGTETGAVPETTRRATIVPVEPTAAYSRPTPTVKAEPSAPTTEAASTTARPTDETTTAPAPVQTDPSQTTTASTTAAQASSASDPSAHPEQAGETSPGQTGAVRPASGMVCPGHIDLKITAKIYSLSGQNNLYELDPNGVAVEGSAWTGWDERRRSYVTHINREDWVSVYDLNVTVENTSVPLSDTEIESYMKLLPPETSEERKNLIRYALQSVGKVPYYWGGKASARNYSGNNFGSITVPDHRGRILRGLDCSGWVNWVYWSVTGNRLPYEGTDGLRLLGRQVARKDLQPGDIIVITGRTPHVIMFLSWTSNGQIQCIHENGSNNNVTVGVMTANWPYYRNLLD